MRGQKLKGNSLLLLTAFIWGTSFIAQSKGVEMISPVAFNGIRSMLGAVILLPVIAVIDGMKRKKNIPIQGFNKKLWAVGGLCGVFLCVATTLQTMGMVYTSPGKAGFITALYMIIVPVVQLFAGKKPRPAVAFAVVVAVIGLYLMCVEPGEKINKGDIIVFACSFMFAGHILTVDKFSNQVDGVKLSCVQFFVCGALNLIYMFAFESPDYGRILDCWVAIGYSGIMSCGVAYTLQIVGQKYTDPTSASIIMSLESVFSTLSTVVLVALGWHITGGALTIKEILGCVLMFVAIIFVQLPEIKIHRRKV